MFLEPQSTVSLTHQSLITYLLYADPGAGTLVWQLVLAAFFGGMFYVRKLKDVVQRRRHRSRAE